MTPAPSGAEVVFAVLLFVAGLAFHAWGASVGWTSRNLPGVEYRQAQTALSTYFIQRDNNFSLAYPTPVLGKPWSVPMEFPLYQWTVVVTSRVTGLGLTKAGRAVSVACFYLSLPALFLLLGRWGVAPGRRWLVLAAVVTCPLYVFYGRAFLIETMALMFSLWFWVAFERAVAERHRGWLALTVLAGVGAGLVKVTTFLLYLLPVAAWALCRLRQGRQDRSWRADLRWMAAAVAVPAAATLWWIWQADVIKARNPMADFLSSANLRDFNLGTLAMHFSPTLWALKARILREELTWWPLLAGAGVLLAVGARPRARAVLFCTLVFAAALVLFPVLYAYHDYYYVANTVALLLALGLVVVGLMESPRFRGMGVAAALLLTGGQAYRYVSHYYPDQKGISPGGNGLSEALQALTRPDEVVVIAGQDWNSMTAYYARRRTLMLRGNAEDSEAAIDTALHQLAGEKIGALVISGKPWRELFTLVRRLDALGLAPEPWLEWGGSWVFLPQGRWQETLDYAHRSIHTGINPVAGARAPGMLGGNWHDLTELSVQQLQLFDGMRPAPVRFLTTFEPNRRGIGSDNAFSLHPWTHLVFRLPPGRHVLTAKVWFDPGAYQVSPGQDATDGVGISLLDVSPGGEPHLLQRQVLSPADRPEDRGLVPLRMEINLRQAGEVELLFDPGLKGRDTRDWLWLRGPLVIE
jgi:hypothetical protein